MALLGVVFGSKAQLRAPDGINLGENASGTFLLNSDFVQPGSFLVFTHKLVSEDYIGYRDNTFFLRDVTNAGGSDKLHPNLDVGRNLYVQGSLGVRTKSPSTSLHVRGNEKAQGASEAGLSGGKKTAHADFVLEDRDAHLDILSSDDGDYGSAINLIDASIPLSGQAPSNNNIWSIVRTTSNAVNGNENKLLFNFGENDHHLNYTKMTLTHDGSLGIGTQMPEATGLHILTKHGNGNYYGIGVPADGERSDVIIESDDAILDLVSSRDGSWGSAINFVEGNGGKNFTEMGDKNKDIWTIMRTTSINNNALYGGKSDLHFRYEDDEADGFHNEGVSRMVLASNGHVGIGVLKPSAKLTVDGKVLSTEVKVQASVVPDYVFADDYDLATLEEVESYVEENHHLPGVPSAQEIADNKGFELGKMNMKLLEKVEELTLHLIEQNKEIKKLNAYNTKMMKRLQKLEKSRK